MGASEKHPGYSAPAALGTVFALAEPDGEPLEGMTRVALAIEETERGCIAWTEFDPLTGEELARGTIETLPPALRGGNPEERQEWAR